MSMDPKNELSFATLINAKSQTNNTGGVSLDTRDYVGQIAVDVSIGAKTAGDSDGAISVRVTHSDTDNISNGTNYSSDVVNTTNATVAAGQISVDTRASKRYIFAVPTVTGTNSPAYPLSVRAIGKKQVE